MIAVGSAICLKPRAEVPVFRLALDSALPFVQEPVVDLGLHWPPTERLAEGRCPGPDSRASEEEVELGLVQPGEVVPRWICPIAT